MHHKKWSASIFPKVMLQYICICFGLRVAQNCETAILLKDVKNDDTFNTHETHSTNVNKMKEFSNTKLFIIY